MVDQNLSDARFYEWATQTGHRATPTFGTLLEVIGRPTPDLQAAKNQRDQRIGNNNAQGMVTGAKSASFSFDVELSGNSTNAATRESVGSDPLDSYEGRFYTRAIGETSITTVTSPDASASPGSGTTVTVASATAAHEGNVFCFLGANDGRYHMRTVDDISGSDYTIDRALVQQDTTSAETVDPNSVIYAAATRVVNNANDNPDPLAIAVEGEDWRREMWGGIIDSMSLNFPADGGICTASFGMQFDDWKWVAATDSPPSQVSTAALPIVALDCQFFVGSNLYYLIEGSFSLEITVQRRQAYSGINGGEYFAVTKRVPKLSGKLYLAGTADGPEVPDDQGGVFEQTGSTAGVLETDTKFDVMLQVGSELGKMIYIRMPRAEFSSFQLGEFNGLDAIDFECMGTSTEAGDISGTSATRGEAILAWG